MDPDHIRDWFDRMLVREHRVEARRTLGGLVRQVPVRGLRRVDHHMRERSEWYRPTGARLTARDVDGLASDGPDRWAVIGLCSMHRDGYVREEAIRLMEIGPLETVLPFVLLRCDDWVEPVRDRALGVVRRAQSQADPADMVSALHAVWDRLMVTGYEERSQSIVDDLCAWLRRVEVLPELRERLQSGDRWDQRLALSVLIETDDAAELERAVRDTDDVHHRDPRRRRLPRKQRRCSGHIRAPARESLWGGAGPRCLLGAQEHRRPKSLRAVHDGPEPSRPVPSTVPRQILRGRPGRVVT